MSDDLIKREDAMRVAFLYPFFSDALMEEINAIPSADRPSAVDLSSVYSTAYKSGYEKGKADRPQGEWIDRSDGGRILHPWRESYECSQCKEQGSGAWNFCPHCGARMKGADDE